MALSKRQEGRLRKMNTKLYPGKLRVLKSGSIQFDYRREGKVIRKVLGDESALEEVYEKALLLRKEATELPLATERDATLGQWYDHWSTERFPNLEKTTIATYTNCWKRIGQELRETRLQKMTRERIEAELEQIDAPSMREHVGVLLSIVLNAAVQAGWLSKSPFKQSFSRKKKVVEILDSQDLERVFAQASDSARPGLVLAGYCGLRREEVMGLRIEDIDLQKKLLYIRRARVRIYGKEGGEYIKGPKNGQPRVLSIPDVAIPHLEPAVEGRPVSEFLYPKLRTDLHRRLQAACRRAGVPELDMHSLRHVCGSNLVMRGGIPAAQAVLGHTNVRTTMDTYSHLTSIYLSRQMNLASMDHERARLEELGRKFLNHENEEIAELARLSVHLCQYSSI